jgi:hypothetical protein
LLLEEIHVWIGTLPEDKQEVFDPIVFGTAFVLNG